MSEIPNKINQKLLNRFVVSNNTLSRAVKDNPKDKIELEIGDSKQPDFKPQVKIMRCKACNSLLSGRNKSYCNVDCRAKQPIWNKGKSGYSTAWNGGKHTEEAKKKMRLAKLGRKLSEEHKQKISKALKGKMPKNIHTLDNSGVNSHWWKGGITPEHERIRKSREYVIWRTAVFMRDDYTCQLCGIRSEKGRRVVLHADHIKPFAKYPKLRLAINNGRTLCVDCHKQTDTYGRTTYANN